MVVFLDHTPFESPVPYEDTPVAYTVWSVEPVTEFFIIFYVSLRVTDDIISLLHVFLPFYVIV